VSRGSAVAPNLDSGRYQPAQTNSTIYQQSIGGNGDLVASFRQIIGKEKVMKTVPLVLLLLVLVAGGCKKDEEPTTAPEAQVIPTELIGTWTAQSAMLGGQPITLTKAFGLTPPAITVTNTFAGNGAFSFSWVDAGKTALSTIPGTAVVTGQYITVTAPMSDGTSLKLIDGSWAVTANQLVINTYLASAGGAGSVTFTK